MSKSKKRPVNNIALKKEENKLRDTSDATRGIGLSAQKLKSETDFLKYIKLLEQFAKRYVVIIAAHDTPCGFMFTPEIGKELIKIGLKTNLAGKFRQAYAAIINAGELIYECLEQDLTKKISYSCVIENFKIDVESAGFQCSGDANSRIIINDINYNVLPLRGLHINVLDTVTESIIDAVVFDTFDEKFPSSRLFGSIQRAVQNYHKLNPHITLIGFCNPCFPKENLSDNENRIITQGYTTDRLVRNPSLDSAL